MVTINAFFQECIPPAETNATFSLMFGMSTMPSNVYREEIFNLTGMTDCGFTGSSISETTFKTKP
jgi:hypothetical protein